MSKTMSKSTKRTLRTLYQGVVALVTVIPVMVAALPADSPLAVKMAGAVAAVAVVTKVLNALEDRGMIPAWLRDDTEA